MLDLGAGIYSVKNAWNDQLVLTVKHLKYKERLIWLQLPTQRYRRMKGDMIEVYTRFLLTSMILTLISVLKHSKIVELEVTTLNDIFYDCLYYVFMHREF